MSTPGAPAATEGGGLSRGCSRRPTTAVGARPLGGRAARGGGSGATGRDRPVLRRWRLLGRCERQRIRHLDGIGDARVDLAADPGERNARLRGRRHDPPADRERAGRGHSGAGGGDDRPGNGLERAVDAAQRLHRAGAGPGDTHRQPAAGTRGLRSGTARHRPRRPAPAKVRRRRRRLRDGRATGWRRAAIGEHRSRRRLLPIRARPARRGEELHSRWRRRRSQARTRRRPPTARTRRSRACPQPARSSGAEGGCTQSTASRCC